MIVPPELESSLKKHASQKQFPDNTPYLSLSINSSSHLSAKFNLNLQQIEIVALQNDIIPEHYARNMRFFSVEDQIALLNSQVGVVGLGGLGGAVSEILARIGIGRLVLFDGDMFEESNLNRQLLSTTDVLDSSKADAAKLRVAEVNPSILCRSHAEYIDETNATDLLAKTDVIVDCLDNIKTRFVVEHTAKQMGVPFISAAVAGFSGQITTIFPEDQGLKLIYGAIEDDVPSKGAETALGTLAPVVTTLASLECAEVVKIILGRGTPLRNRLLIVDLLDNTFEVLTL